MKRRIWMIALAMVLAVSLFGLVACNENDAKQPAAETVKVTFDLDYDNLTLPSMEIKKGTRINEPLEPVRAEYVFDEWQANGTGYDFASAVESDLELKAAWKAEEEPAPPVEEKLTVAVAVVFGEERTVKSFTEEKGVALSDVLGKISELSAYLDAGNWISSVAAEDGTAYDETVQLLENVTLTVTVSEPQRVYVNLGGVRLTAEGVKGNTLAALQEAFDTEPYLFATVDGQSVQVGKGAGWYSDAAFTKPIAETDVVANYSNVYYKINWTVSAYTLGVNVDVKILDKEVSSHNAKENNLRTVSNLFSVTKFGAKVTFGGNNQITEIDTGPAVLQANDIESYYIVLNGSVLSALTGNLEGSVKVVRATDENGDTYYRTEYTKPYVEVKMIDRDEMNATLKTALNTYLSSDSFKNSVKNVTTIQGRVPMMYLKYLDETYYTEEIVQEGFKELVLDKMESVIDKNGAIDDTLWADSSVKTQGWYGYFDFLYTWSLTYQQYNDYLLKTGKTEADNEYAKYKTAVQNYLEKWCKLLFEDNLYNDTYALQTLFSGWSNIGKEGYPATVGDAIERAETLIQKIKPLYNDPDFLAGAEWIENNLYRLRMTSGDKAISLFKTKATAMTNSIRIRASFGYGYTNIILATYANLGFLKAEQPAAEQLPGVQKLVKWYEDTYYALNEDGTRKPSTGCNWVGFSGAPLTRSLLKGISDLYSVEYEKAQQAYFPYQDMGMVQQGLDAMINMDRLFDFYNHTLNTSSGVAPEYALLTMYCHGIDAEHYKKAVETVNTDNEYNIISLWMNENVGEDGAVVINNYIDMAVAIAYLAHSAGVESPNPLGVISSGDFVIGMTK